MNQPAPLDQVIFRWHPRNVAGTTGMGPVAHSCSEAAAIEVYDAVSAALWSGAATLGAARIVMPGGQAVLLRRVPSTDGTGRRTFLTHAIVGSPELLRIGRCLALAWPYTAEWDFPAQFADASGQALGRIPAREVEELTSKQRLVAEDVVRADIRPAALLLAARLRSPGARWVVLDSRAGGRDVVAGLYAANGLARELCPPIQTFDTCAKAEVAGSVDLSVLPEPPLPGALSPDLVLIDARAPADDEAGHVAERLLALWREQDKRAEAVRKAVAARVDAGATPPAALAAELDRLDASRRSGAPTRPSAAVGEPVRVSTVDSSPDLLPPPAAEHRPPGGSLPGIRMDPWPDAVPAPPGTAQFRVPPTQPPAVGVLAALHDLHAGIRAGDEARIAEAFPTDDLVLAALATDHVSDEDRELMLNMLLQPRRRRRRRGRDQVAVEVMREGLYLHRWNGDDLGRQVALAKALHTRLVYPTACRPGPAAACAPLVERLGTTRGGWEILHHLVQDGIPTGLTDDGWRAVLKLHETAWRMQGQVAPRSLPADGGAHVSRTWSRRPALAALSTDHRPAALALALVGLLLLIAAVLLW